MVTSSMKETEYRSLRVNTGWTNPILGAPAASHIAGLLFILHTMFWVSRAKKTRTLSLTEHIEGRKGQSGKKCSRVRDWLRTWT